MLSTKTGITFLSIACLSITLAGCAVGPDYQRPALEVPADFREMPGWKLAQPRADQRRGDWWAIYGDVALDELMSQLNAQNQDIRAAEARYRQARALVRNARAGFLPNVGANGAVTRGSANFSSSTTSTITDVTGRIETERDAMLDASWELDVWGRVRREVEASTATALASLGDLEGARLSAQAELAINYFQLRVLDARQQLFTRTLAAYEKSLQITENRYAVGVASRADVVQAQAQLYAAQAEALDNRVQRTQLEHAIAVQLGKPPSAFALAPMPIADEVTALAGLSVPIIPSVLPSELLERRPDVAAAEQRVMAANADIGVAQAAYYPTLSLGASGGYRSTSATDWLSAPNRYWSVGPALAMTLFDGGRRSAEKERAEAAYDETVAGYRQSVLTAFQEVEDNLVAARLLEEQAQVQDAAVTASRKAVEILNNQYRAGKAGYLEVVTAQTTALANERQALQVLGQRYSASVLLVRAAGGGWSQEH